MPSKVYLYYAVKEGHLACIVCDYPYAMDAPLSTLKKHLRVKHSFSIRHPPPPHLAQPYARIDVQSLLNPPPETTTYTFVNYPTPPK